ncbi:unnamed protein product [Rhizophagus irregularis]|nr:unnamed protein product [Rhizophagus irregularis]
MQLPFYETLQHFLIGPYQYLKGIVTLENTRKSAPNILNSVEIGSGVESRIQRNCFGMDNQQYKLRKVSASLGVSAFMGGYEGFLEGFG